jgi:hypothetical protein
MNTYEGGEDQYAMAEGGEVAVADTKMCGLIEGWNGRGISMALSSGSSKDPDLFFAKQHSDLDRIKSLRRQHARGRQFPWCRCRTSCLVESSH